MKYFRNDTRFERWKILDEFLIKMIALYTNRSGRKGFHIFAF